MTIGTKIRNLRVDRGWSQGEFSVKLGIGQTTLGSIETGETKKIDFLLMDKICKEFNVDSDFFKETTKVRQVYKDQSVGGYVENQIINNLSEKLIEILEEQIKELKSKNILLEIEIKLFKDKFVEEIR